MQPTNNQALITELEILRHNMKRLDRHMDLIKDLLTKLLLAINTKKSVLLQLDEGGSNFLEVPVKEKEELCLGQGYFG